MIILVSDTSGSYTAQVRSALELGFKKLYQASCTAGRPNAARAVVRKYFGPKAADSVRELKDPAEIRAAIGNFCDSPRRKTVFSFYGFNPKGGAQ